MIQRVMNVLLLSLLWSDVGSGLDAKEMKPH